MDRPKVEGIHHAAIICSDYERSKKFYSQVLGFEQLDENYRADRDSYKLDLKLPDGSQIELFSMPGSPPRLSYPEAQGLRHLAFAVTDLEAWSSWLNHQGVATQMIRVDPYTDKRFLFFNDPDDLPLELYEMTHNLKVCDEG